VQTCGTQLIGHPYTHTSRSFSSSSTPTNTGSPIPAAPSSTPAPTSTSNFVIYETPSSTPILITSSITATNTPTSTATSTASTTSSASNQITGSVNADSASGPGNGWQMETYTTVQVQSAGNGGNDGGDGSGGSGNGISTAYNTATVTLPTTVYVSHPPLPPSFYPGSFGFFNTKAHHRSGSSHHNHPNSNRLDHCHRYDNYYPDEQCECQPSDLNCVGDFHSLGDGHYHRT
jgi:hypothetical protein